jgi:hypothetical protein
LVLILTILVNLFAFQKIADKKVILYQQEISTNTFTPNPEKLKAFTELSSLDTQTREEYTAVLEELSVISTALENISSHPELYISSSGASSSTSLSIATRGNTSNNLPIPVLFNIRTF